jgi:hypothetical protein
MAGLLNFNNQPQQGGLLAGLQNAVGNPMTLAGLGLLSGEGFGGAMRGAQLGMSFQDQQRQEAERRRKQQGFESLLGQINAPPDVLALARFQGPEAATETIGQWVGPAQEARRLEMDLLRARIAKAQREASGAAKYGKAGAIFQGSDGNFYTAQFAEDGTVRYAPAQIPGQDAGGPVALTPARGVMEVGDSLVDKSTGGTVRNVGDNLEEAKRREALGKERGEVAATLPAVEAASQRALDTVQSIRNHPGKRWGVGAAGILPGIPGTQQRGFVTLVDQAKGQAFLEAPFATTKRSSETVSKPLGVRLAPARKHSPEGQLLLLASASTTPRPEGLSNGD